MESNLGMWGISDLWGDYDLLLGASKRNLEIVDVPVHYQERIYGVTKMNKVFTNGIRMFRICFHAWLRLGGQRVPGSVMRGRASSLSASPVGQPSTGLWGPNNNDDDKRVQEERVSCAN